MIVTMFWHGGSNYACFDTHDKRDAEEFPSLEAARHAFASRLGFDPYYPCTDETAEAWIVKGRAADNIGADHPDYVLRVGPRGGIIQERT